MCGPREGVGQGSPRCSGRGWRSFTLATTGLPLGSLPVLTLGPSSTLWGATPLPLALAAFGLPGCDLLVSPDAALVFGPLAQPVFDVTLGIPNDPGLAGLALFAETAGLGGATLHLSAGLGLRTY